MAIIEARLSDAQSSLRVQRVTMEQFRKNPELISGFYPHLVRFAARLMGGREGAEDLVQTTLANVWAAPTTEGDMLSYMHKALVHNRIKEVNRDRRREEIIGQRVVYNGEIKDPTTDVADAAIRKMEVVRIVKGLKGRVRELFVSALYLKSLGFSDQEISDQLGVSNSAVRSGMNSARTAARNLDSIQKEEVGKRRLIRELKMGVDGKIHTNVLFLADEMGLSMSDVAEVLGVPVGTAKSRLNRARAAARRAA